MQLARILIARIILPILRINNILRPDIKLKLIPAAAAYPTITGTLCSIANSPTDLYVLASRPKKGTNIPFGPAF